MLRSNSKSLWNHVVSPEKEKERLQWEGFAEKAVYLDPPASRPDPIRRISTWTHPLNSRANWYLIPVWYST